MQKTEIYYQPIGIIHTPHPCSEGTPIQSNLSDEVEGSVEIYDDFLEGLNDLNGFSRIWLIYHFHRSTQASLIVTPYLDTKQHGLFSTRAPSRPNPIGISAVRLLEIKGNIVRVSGVDMLDGTPLLDIKPYVPQFDSFPSEKSGWLETVDNKVSKADARFEK